MHKSPSHDANGMLVIPRQPKKELDTFSSANKPTSNFSTFISTQNSKPTHQDSQKIQLLSALIEDDSPFKVGEVVVGSMSKPRRIPIGQSRLQTVIVSMAVLVFGTGMFVSLQTLFTNHDTKAQVKALSKKSSKNEDSNSSSVVPSEDKPKGGGPAYQVAPNAPKYLKIPKLGVDARVKSLGVNNKNQLSAPYSIYDAGWYNASAHPGDSGSLGAVVMDGHVHGPTRPGVFVGLKNLSAGDTIQIVSGDNQVFNYKVIRVQNYDAASINMGMMMASAQPGVQGLNLITCGGPYNHQTGEYSERTVVFAVQI